MNIEIIKPYRLDKFLSSKENKRIFITGSSGSGKSTLWNALEENLGSTLAFPTRLISRPARPDDDIKENRHLNFDDFELLFKEKVIEFFWPKFLPNGTEYYGFEFTDRECMIYSCNNEFLLNYHFLRTHSDLSETGIIVHVKTDVEIRKNRLLKRCKNHNISESELLYRLTFSEDSIIGKYDIIINNNEDILTTSSNLIDLLF